MLRDLRVRNLGVIEDLTLSLGPGMTALTGETGAGKTLLVEALQLVLGGRAAPGLVRAGATEAVVEARFELPETGSGPGGEVVLSRSVPASGRSRAWVDGRMAPVGALAEHAARLVDIHGQHEHQSLLHPAAQQHALDAFAEVDLSAMTVARRRLRLLDERLDALGGDARQRAREVDLVRHQLTEIEHAVLRGPDEDEQLEAEEERLAGMQAHRQAAAAALTWLAGREDGVTANGDGPGAHDALGRAADQLAGRAPFAEWEGRLRATLTEVSDVASDLRGVVEGWEDDPVRLHEVQARRRLLHDLRHKYGPTLADVVASGERAAQQLNELLAAAEEADLLAASRASAEADLRAAESAVREARSAAAPALAGAVGRRLAELAMAGARLEIAVGDHGAGEPVQFLLGANPGEPLQPLQRVASGGELARTMLALRLVASGGPATMVFDEVDAGVGGRAALALAGALREASAGRQVLVVTHLAQVAAFADHQVAVHKLARGARTSTGSERLGPEERVVEISRMLSGHPDSATARAHAVELLALGRSGGQSATGDGRVV
ncbi:MAG TPA: DNA repair protein RecN [Acidimicrobiales bacterium]|nr:DNA repair protein RecN [Acidimicrobiales bacterium]